MVFSFFFYFFVLLQEMAEKGTGCGHIFEGEKCMHEDCRAERKKKREEERREKNVRKRKRDKESVDKLAQERGKKETESSKPKRPKTESFAEDTASLPPVVSPVANKVFFFKHAAAFICCLCSVCSR